MGAIKRGPAGLAGCPQLHLDPTLTLLQGLGLEDIKVFF